MATTGHWYINPDGTKVDFTDPSADINAAAGTVTREIRKVTTDPQGSSQPVVQLWKAAGAHITAGEITAAIADQDDAAVPALQEAPPAPQGYQHAAVADVGAVMADIGGAPSQANFNALLATVRQLQAAVNALLATGRGEGSVAP